MNLTNRLRLGGAVHAPHPDLPGQPRCHASTTVPMVPTAALAVTCRRCAAMVGQAVPAPAEAPQIVPVTLPAPTHTTEHGSAVWNVGDGPNEVHMNPSGLIVVSVADDALWANEAVELAAALLAAANRLTSKGQP